MTTTRRTRAALSLIAPLVFLGCAADGSRDAVSTTAHPAAEPAAASEVEIATFAAGCFWCSEAAFEQIEGVLDVQSGFMGGGAADPNDAHALVEAGHAEVTQVTFDPRATSYETILEWFWRIHDPTSVDKQGEDEGPEYRSAIFFYSDEQRASAEASHAALAPSYEQPIVTEIARASEFYAASQEHQDYYQRNRASAYCRQTIAPHLLRVGLED